ncbi:putative ABC transporter ATP-binding component [Parolsenella catena]|uniref:Putative ABC transporter ATP-binding component n=1 Tax=Parolsenella catena TaxID=2003188 RepID=A0A3G9K9E1_9ACTN|nr:methionine ABC transporter ATP-binding protein [Parolsenella catena]BBH49490.1 putative ABC transporter ATP-binding component [Parolsenella catena]
MIELTNISKVYDTPAGPFHAIDDVTLSIGSGDIFGIIGESGAGKSTLVRCINLLEQPTSGSVVIDGHDVTSLRGRDLRELRADIGMIFQRFSLFEQRTVLDNVIFPATLASTGKRVSRAEAPERARKLLALVGLEGKEGSYPSQLSGGQQQRVAIARALMTSPKTLLCDEATSALDTLTTSQVLDLLGRINRELGVTIVLITHSLAVARRICNHVVVMDHGHVVEQGTAEEIFSNPQADVTRALLQFEGEGR